MTFLATWWVQATPGTTYWRCTIPARHLKGQALHLTEDDLLLDEHGEPFMPRHKGAGIWQFPGNATRALIMAHQQEMGTKVLVEVDDNYLMPPPHITFLNSPWKRKASRGGGPDDHSFEAHRVISKWADGVIVSTEPLADAYERVNPNVYICPNSVDLRDWSEPSWIDDGKVRVGYAGSDSHLWDVALVERALSYAAHHESGEVWKLGVRHVDWKFPHQVMPWTDALPEYRRNLKVLDVGLCPLKRSPWHDCKSDIKACEYTMAGALPIVQSDTPVYKDWLEVVPSAATEKEWLKRVKEVLALSTEDRRKLWRDAYDFLTQNKLIEQHIHKWQEAIT